MDEEEILDEDPDQFDSPQETPPEPEKIHEHGRTNEIVNIAHENGNTIEERPKALSARRYKSNYKRKEYESGELVTYPIKLGLNLYPTLEGLPGGGKTSEWRRSACPRDKDGKATCSTCRSYIDFKTGEKDADTSKSACMYIQKKKRELGFKVNHKMKQEQFLVKDEQQE